MAGLLKLENHMKSLDEILVSSSEMVKEAMTRLYSSTPRGFTDEQKAALDEYDGPIQSGYAGPQYESDDVLTEEQFKQLQAFNPKPKGKQYDPVALVMKQASIIKTLALTSAAIKNGTITVIRVPDSAKRKLKQSA